MLLPGEEIVFFVMRLTAHLTGQSDRVEALITLTEKFSQRAWKP